MACGIALFAIVLAEASRAEGEAESKALVLHGEMVPTLLDYGLPDHPKRVGFGQRAAILRAYASFAVDDFLTVEAGGVGRLPFALDFHEELAALPHFALVFRPWRRAVALRLGSLETRHGFHPALVDEELYAVARPYEVTYNQSLLPEAHRRLKMDPFLPVETGGQILVDIADFEIDAFLDWQILETRHHQEKFAAGLVARFEQPSFDLSGQLRVVHYGGEQFTASDPIRREGLDAKRQPITMALTATIHPVLTEGFRVEVPVAFIYGRMIQVPGEPDEAHHGLEPGVDLTFFETVRLGYRAWLPRRGRAMFLSEDGDPVYSSGRSHRAVLGSVLELGHATLDARVDLVFPEGSNEVQYLTVTTLRFAFDWVLLSAPARYP